MKTTGQRIYQVRKLLGLTQKEFGKLAGVTKAAVSQWERDVTSPERDPLLALQQSANISPYWVTNEKGKMFNELLYGVNEERAEYSMEDIATLNKIKNLSADNKARLDGIIDALDSNLDKKTS